LKDELKKYIFNKKKPKNEPSYYGLTYQTGNSSHEIKINLQKANYRVQLKKTKKIHVVNSGQSVKLATRVMRSR
jgi:hypothetical protein